METLYQQMNILLWVSQGLFFENLNSLKFLKILENFNFLKIGPEVNS